MAKGALQSTALPSFLVHVFEKDSAHNIFTKRQHERFSVEQLKTGGWFLDCSNNYVPTTEEELARSVAIIPSVQRHLDVANDANDDDFVEEVPRRGRRAGKKRVNLTSTQGPPVRNAPIAAGGPSSQAESDPCVTQASERIADLGIASPTQKERFNRLVRGRESKRPLLPESSTVAVSNLPLFLEHGDMGELLNLSEANHSMEPQAVRIMQHIRQVISIHSLASFIEHYSYHNDVPVLMFVLA